MGAGITNEDVNGEVVAFPATVAGSAQVSDVVDMKAKRLHRIFAPAGATACDVTFDVGHGASVAPLKTAAGTDYTVKIVPGASTLVDFSSFFGIQFVKLKFSVAQAALAFNLIGVPR